MDNLARVIRLPVKQPASKPRPFGSVKRRSGSTKLYLEFEYRGRTVKKSTGLEDTAESRKQVREFLDQIGAAILGGIFRFAEAFPGSSEEEKTYFSKLEGCEYCKGPEVVTFGEYLDRWIPENLDKEPSETKRRDYGQAIRCHLRPRFGQTTFDRLTGLEIVQFVKDLREKGRSPNRIRNVLIPLRVIWEDAVEEHG